MWSAFIILQFLYILKPTHGHADCGIQVPPKDGKFQLFLKAFRWRTPLDSYNGTKDAIPHGATVTFTCENGFVRNEFVGESYTFECCNGRFNKTLSYEDVLCRSDFHKDTKTFHVPNVQLGSGILKCEGKNLEVYQVKSRKANGCLKQLYTVCFDTNVMRTKFVFQPRKREGPAQRREQRRDVWGFDFFGKTAKDKLRLSDGYVSRIQKRRITNSFPNKYNKNNKYPYSFNRGHLAPYSDFTEPEDKRASCEYINVAPQWKELNGNSWSVVERETKEVVQNNSSEWEIYTGTYGHIPTTRGPLFLSPFFDERGKFQKGFVPVPRLYWKVVHNLYDKNKSKVFIGVNNPELKSPEEFTEKYLICKPKVSNRGGMFQGSEFKGFTYECDFDEFLEKLGRDEGVVRGPYEG